MSGYCPGCGTYHEEDDDRMCAKCGAKVAPKAISEPVGQSVNRWDLFTDVLGLKGMVHEPEGRFVKFTDYAALSAELAEVRGVLKVMEDALINIGEYWNGAENDRAMSDACYHNRETATDALARAATVKGGK